MTISVAPSGVSFVTQLFSSLPQGLASADSLSLHDVLVASSHDRVDLVLNQHQVPYQAVERRRLAGPALGDAKYLLIGCGEPLSRGVPGTIAEWVRGGGRLLTTERLLSDLLAEDFRDEQGRRIIQPLVRGRTHVRTAGNDIVPVSEAVWADAAANALLEGGERLFWKVKIGSCPIQILDTDRVEVLARSFVLGGLYFGSDALFVRFPYGQGEVMHLFSHWDLQELDVIPTSADERGSSSRISIPPLPSSSKN